MNLGDFPYLKHLDASTLLRGIELVNDYAIIFLHPDGTIGSWNKSAEMIKGYTTSDVIGKHFSMLYTEPDLLRNYPEYELKMAKQNGRYEDEGWRKRKDGTIFWANVVFSPIYDNSGTFVGFLKITRDLTERRKTEKRLRTLEQGIDEVRDYAIVLLGTAGDVLSWNKGAQMTFHYSEEEALQMNMLDFYTEKEKTEGLGLDHLSQASKNGRFERVGWQMRKGGTEFWSSFILNSIQSEVTGELEGFLMVIRDLTDQQTSCNRYLTLERGIECVKDYAIFMLDQTGRVVTWNKGAERIKGWKKEEAIGVHMREFYPSDLRECGTPEAHLLWAEKKGRYEGQGWRVRKDNSTFFANVVITAVFNHKTELIGFIKVTRDLSERELLIKSKQSALACAESARTRAETLNALMEQQQQFTTRICHEIRNPLHGIYGSVEIAEDLIGTIPKLLPSVVSSLPTPSSTTTTLPSLPSSPSEDTHDINISLPSNFSSSSVTSSSTEENTSNSPSNISTSTVPVEGEEALRTIQQNVASALSVLESIRECARHQQAIADETIRSNLIEGAPVITQHVAFDPRSIVNSVKKMYLPGAIAKGLALDVQLPSQMVLIQADPSHMKEILINLVSNALKYTDQGTVSIKMSYKITAETRIRVDIFVADTGRGFDENQSPVNRPQTSDYKKYASNGVGISLCKRLAKAVGCTLHWDSKIGQGTTVTFSLETEMLPTSGNSPRSNHLELLMNPALSPYASPPPSPPVEAISDDSSSSTTTTTTSTSTSSSTSSSSSSDSSSGSSSDDSGSASPRENYHLQMDSTFSPEALRSARILLVEDNHLNQRIILSQLKRVHCIADVANNGEEALELYKTRPYDLILMDIIMPVLNGLDCARLIRKEEKEQHRSRVPIIALSGNAQECDKSSALEAGMDDYLTKPHTRLELYSKLLCHVVPVALD